MTQTPLNQHRCRISPDDRQKLQSFLRFFWVKYNLRGYCEVSDLLNEVILEFCQSSDKVKARGGEIEFPLSYMKVIAHRHCNRILGSRGAAQSLVARLKLHSSENEPESLQGLYQAELIELARAQLSADENELVELRIYRGWAWEKICKHYHQNGFIDCSTAMLRKRFERIKLKLANFFIQLGIDSSEI